VNPAQDKRLLERWLREQGATKTQAVAAVSRAWSRYGWMRNVMPRLFVRLAKREVGRG
jgi:hypothetical protein